MIKRLLLLFSLFYLSCFNEPPTLFNLTTESEFNIPAGLDNFQTHTFFMRNVPTRIHSYVNSSNTDAISGIFANRANIEALFTNFDFSFVRMAVINIWAPGFPEDKKEVFFMDLLNNQGREELQLFSSLSNVKDILLNDTFDAEVRLLFRGFTPTAIESRLTMNFVAHGK